MTLVFNPQPKPDKTGKKPRKPLPKVSQKRTKYRQTYEYSVALEYMGRVKQLPCCICGNTNNIEAHHCFHGRYGQRKSSDFDVIPLCMYCHRVGPFAIHNDKARWAEDNGPDHTYIKQTQRQIATIVDDLIKDWL